MTYGVARAATSPELALYRSPGKWSTWRAAILQPRTVYTARINQTFSTTDGVLEITYDGGSGTLAEVLPDMTMLIGSTAGAHDVGIVRLRDKDAAKFYIGETSDVDFANDLYLTVLEDFTLWARHVLISAGVTYMDGAVEYDDQHADPDPTPIMGSHRVVELTGASVSVDFDWSDSYVIGGLSTITGYATSCPTAASVTNPTTATPTVVIDTPGTHAVYLTPTAANGKTFFGVRYVHVWDADHPLASLVISDPRQDAESGGWEFEILGYTGVDESAIRDHACVLLVAEDHFDGTQSNIGPVAGSENIEVVGRIAREINRENPEQGDVRFVVHTADYWLAQIPAFPDGVEFVPGTPKAWTEFQDLTVDKGVWHFLHWRTTATRVMDVFLTGDTLYTREVSSMASNLWEQIREMSYNQIYARAGCNAWNQLFIEVHPQMVPEADRDWATVMTITKPDWLDEIVFERRTKPEVSFVSFSGVAVNANGVGSSHFAFSPGRAYPHYGRPDPQDNFLVASQVDALAKAGLYRGWQNNPLPEIPISLVADVRLIDCFPRSFCALAIAAGDTPRGKAYSGNLIPISVTIVTDAETGRRRREVVFEAETFQDLAVDGDWPGSRADTSYPSLPSLPPLPPILPVIIPGVIEPTVGGPQIVVVHDANVLFDAKGLLYCTDFNTSDRHWQFFNAGIETEYRRRNISMFFRTPSGACYCAIVSGASPSGDMFVARAPVLGGTWETIFDSDDLGSPRGVVGMGFNPLLPEVVGVIIYDGNDGYPSFWLGTNGVFEKKVAVAGTTYGHPWWVSFGQDKWLITSYSDQPDGKAKLVAADGSSVVATTDYYAVGIMHARASTSGKTFHHNGGTVELVVAEDNFATYTVYSSIPVTGFENYPIVTFDCDPSGQYCMSRYNPGAFRRSSDFGATWGTMANLPVGNYQFRYAGGVGLTSRWLAAGGTEIYYSEDFGDTWEERTGNLLDLIAVPSLNQIYVLEP